MSACLPQHCTHALSPVQGNAFGGQGLLHLCHGIASCVTLTQVNLRAIGVCHQDTNALSSFANVMSCHPALQDVNLNGNLIGKPLTGFQLGGAP